MKILLTGALGQVGWELQRTLSSLGKVVATDRRSLDLTNERAIRAAIRAFRPDWVVNAAAYTAVDDAERDEPAAMWMNAAVPRILAEEVERLSGWMVHYSTDYIFDGSGTRPYREDDPTAPLGAYGRSKLAGELAMAATGANYLLFRAAWIYGTRGRNFLRTIQRLAREQVGLRVVSDQVGVPTWSRQVAEATALVMAQRPSVDQMGVYHLAGDDSCSWHTFAEEILRLDPDPRTLTATTVHPITSTELSTLARRPLYSVLDGSHGHEVFGVKLAPWSTQLAICMAEQRIG